MSESVDMTKEIIDVDDSSSDDDSVVTVRQENVKSIRKNAIPCAIPVGVVNIFEQLIQAEVTIESLYHEGISGSIIVEGDHVLQVIGMFRSMAIVHVMGKSSTIRYVCFIILGK